MDRILHRVKDAGLHFETSKEGLIVNDPSMNRILLTESQIE